ncbi:retrovirus polyprotein [Penicillium cosmopolitanum]|uniref:Retrovirus polyprotein n=1 Tax=Penicillium cosmopolitanum TaxID=1131564 RepID=A0A9W9WAR8_9EURO|nr:retrovirus polyprotein [Penicillium cosmopolitanum]KAJ5413888.1 retrovirus polyprotein [Penicillium cosmopolitanum]
MKPLGVIAERLQDPIPLIGFDGRPADPVTHVTHLTLTIQGFRQVSAQFMITGLGHRQAIIGRPWFEETGALLDCKNRRIIMPDEPSLTDIVKTGLEQKIPLQILRPPLSESHQADADRLTHTKRIRQGR